MRAEASQGERRERFLAAALGARHQHPAVDHDQEVLRAALAQLELALGRVDHFDGVPGLHYFARSSQPCVHADIAGMFSVKVSRMPRSIFPPTSASAAVIVPL